MTPAISALTSPEEAEAVVAEIRGNQREFAVGDDRCVAALSAVSRALLRHEPRRPAWIALGHWLREASVRSTLQALSDRTPRGGMRVPRGVVFHVTPTNVDTMAIYTWALAFMCGNASVMRISPRVTDEARTLVNVVDAALREHPDAARITRFVTYDRDDAITQALSASDVRMLWGGDASVQAVRNVPGLPSAVDIPFVDRISLSALDAGAVLREEAPKLRQLGRNLATDAFWFDQLGCSSPKTIVLVGDADSALEAFNRLLPQIADGATSMGYVAEAAAVLEKVLAASELLASGQATEARMVSPEVTVIYDATTAMHTSTPGAGFFTALHVRGLQHLVPLLDRKNQTLSHFGFTTAELQGFVQAAGTMAPDRLVPIGQALSFDAIWDGFDLPSLLTRAVTVRA